MGYTPGDASWANLGQGSPETGSIPGDIIYNDVVQVDETNRHYSSVAGDTDLREKIAQLYNELYRKDKKSKYTYGNVSICNGGRLALTRIAASLGNIHMGHFIPDYTAYEELLTLFKSFIPIPIQLDENSGFTISNIQLQREIQEKGLQALLLSNPSNPTGRLMHGNELKGWVTTAREEKCTMIFDEFYSHFIYATLPTNQNTISAARYVEDVNSDPIVIVDGFTKNWRLPGIRLGWIVGPESVIESVNSAGSFIDGGANHPSQQYVKILLEPERVKKRANILQDHFKKKRDFMLQSLKQIGLTPALAPEGTFYIWVSLHTLPEYYRDGMHFFRACLKEKIIVVPGEFFDVNPGKRRLHGKYHEYCRISYGPSMGTLKVGIKGLQRIVAHTK